jgi:hypothetical protein
MEEDRLGGGAGPAGLLSHGLETCDPHVPGTPSSSPLAAYNPASRYAPSVGRLLEDLRAALKPG